MNQKTPATVVITHHVRPGREADYARWRQTINTAVEDFDGFERAEVFEPKKGVQDEWVIVARFRSAETLAQWLGSDERKALLAQAEPLLVDRHQQVVATPDGVATPLTVVVAQKVKPGRERDFEKWQAGITRAAQQFPGYISSELFRPVAGVQDEWVVVFRFANAEQLDHWLHSGERQQWLEKAEPYLESVEIHRVGAGLGGWFPVNPALGQRPPPRWKQAVAVLLALYPTVMLLRVALPSRLESLPFAVDIFMRLTLSVVILAVAMPYVNRLLKRWHYPATRLRSLVGTVLIVALFGAMIALFVSLPA